MNNVYNIGIDVGSTTVKVVVLKNRDIIYKEYTRHYSDVKKSVRKVINNIYDELGNIRARILMTGSVGINIAKEIKIEFVQEVIASTKAIETFNPEADVVIELGGEDAKITYLTGGIDQRMNGICAGGTGAFIDQMASLLKTDAKGLNELAKGYAVIYPIASRCGVFAKTDIQPLINDGANKSDIAMSIFNAVVVQTVSVLSCGRQIKGNIAFLGGPLYFLSQLREAFKNNLNLKDENIIFPNNAQLYVAIGAALLSEKEDSIDLKTLLLEIDKSQENITSNTDTLQPLFLNEEEYINFIKIHDNSNKVKYKNINEHSGNCYLGIDAGSTTTKATLIDDDCNILYTYYKSNEGKPLDSVIYILKDIYSKLTPNSKIVNSTVTGYGEGFIKKALSIDIGEIETIAHYKAAKYFNQNVDFILDIGGQDMKCLKIKNGVIDSIILNEACSAGCGSFLETFAQSLSMDIKEFSKKGIYSKTPIDLGSKCTVFMNSKVKQAQKEGASVSDISAGLSYSIIKNALFKVIKLHNISEIGENIVVQGGTFYNDLVLRAFEKLINHHVIRPNICGLMGAFGSALISKNQYIDGYKTTLIKESDIDNLKFESYVKRCNGCSNKCLLTVNEFNNKDIYVSGNRCEKGELIINKKNTKHTDSKNVINLFNYKYNRVFEYKPLNIEKAYRGEIGIPRSLNIYEDYPFWFTFFSELGFRVVLSNRSSKSVYEKGISSIASESVCYPAKMVHGHIENLIEKNIKNIFYPSVVYETSEDKYSDNHFNCPVVTSYSEVIKNNMESLKSNNINFMNPFVTINNKKKLKKVLYDELYHKFNINKSEISNAVDKASIEQENFKSDIQYKGLECLKYLEENNKKGIVLCGRPYHIDPEINHGIPELINSLDMAVLTEDSICHLSNLKRPLRVVDQWVYHSRLYKAADFIKDKTYLELVQLNSFGCGIDAVTTDQVQEILQQKGKIYTLVKIDEGNNLGAVKIRLRSLKAAIKERDLNNSISLESKITEYKRSPKDPLRNTILVPQMAPIHFDLFEKAINLSGINLEVLKDTNKEIIEEGLKYVNNDACYPAIITIGQLVKALKSGKYDLNTTSVAITQTGGGCRATNYIGFLRKAIKDAGFKDIPVISLNVSGLDGINIAKKITPKLINRLFMACIYGDLLMKVLYRVRPYEKYKGSANQLFNKWMDICKDALIDCKISKFKENIKNIVYEFDNLEVVDMLKPKVGLVGEILVKFHPIANNNLVDIIESEGAEAIVPDLTNFFLTCAYNTNYKNEYLEGRYKNKLLGNLFIKIVDIYQNVYKNELKKSTRFSPPEHIKVIAENTSSVVSIGNQTGEGWLLTGEMIELIHEGINNIICMQPFGCLPNHIVGKGPIKELKRLYNDVNIIPIDYDPSASEVNQLNRIKLMLSKAFKSIDITDNSNLDLNEKYSDFNDKKMYKINLDNVKVNN
ncbi:acyl-CoA dehydratase activase-related protein [Romboutsia sp. 1001713B170207_170306_H8]|uniref:acyl-CoA dehydratase activase-related protein n=1 Tax=Romboutsia sp. 1001713B170207_170306_H8 TaxID=2787112 RepID=UPI001899E0B6|nr:2-hydroxyacyl-CoA dehydratase [Romboutsia sp. 1001713B170207_170306_H8]